MTEANIIIGTAAVLGTGLAILAAVEKLCKAAVPTIQAWKRLVEALKKPRGATQKRGPCSKKRGSQRKASVGRKGSG